MPSDRAERLRQIGRFVLSRTDLRLGSPRRGPSRPRPRSAAGAARRAPAGFLCFIVRACRTAVLTHAVGVTRVQRPGRVRITRPRARSGIWETPAQLKESGRGLIFGGLFVRFISLSIPFDYDTLCTVRFHCSLRVVVAPQLCTGLLIRLRGLIGNSSPP